MLQNGTCIVVKKKKTLLRIFQCIFLDLFFTFLSFLKKKTRKKRHTYRLVISKRKTSKSAPHKGSFKNDVMLKLFLEPPPESCHAMSFFSLSSVNRYQFTILDLFFGKDGGFIFSIDNNNPILF